jgi:predicted PurR-regulated permease PerM
MLVPVTFRIPPAVFWVVIIAVFVWILTLLSPILLPFVVGMGVAYLLDPLADKLERRGMSRGVATTVLSVGFFALLLFGLFALIPAMIEQFTSLIGALPQYVSTLREAAMPYLARLSHQLQVENNAEALRELSGSIGAQVQGVVGSIFSSVLKSGFALLNVAALLMITPLVSFYLLRDWDGIMRDMDDLLPRRYAPVIREQLQAIDRTLAAFVRGQLNVMAVLIVYYAITLSIIGLNYALIMALLAGVLIIIPYLGTVLTAGLALGIAYMQFGVSGGLAAVAGVFIVGQLLEGYVLTPKLIGESVGLNPLWIIFGMLAGGSLMGFVGMLIAVPLTAVLGVLIRFAIAQYSTSSFYKSCSTDI